MEELPRELPKRAKHRRARPPGSSDPIRPALRAHKSHSITFTWLLRGAHILLYLLGARPKIKLRIEEADFAAG